jgi:hypothetical protein
LRVKEREAFENRGLIKTGKTELGDAVDMRGSCLRMCSDYEREFREYTREVHQFEEVSLSGKLLVCVSRHYSIRRGTRERTTKLWESWTQGQMLWAASERYTHILLTHVQRTGDGKRIDPEKAVAAYTRSDAGAGLGDSAILPSDLRTPETLVVRLNPCPIQTQHT